jgi:hypothetical protein
LVEVLEDQVDCDLAAFGSAAVTVCCSYHVALTALLGGRAVIHLSENEYYRHKARGLAELFGLPDELLVDINETPPGAIASRALALLDEVHGGRKVIEPIERGRQAAIEARRRAEQDLERSVQRWLLEVSALQEESVDRAGEFARGWAETASGLWSARRELDALTRSLAEVTDSHDASERRAQAASEEARRLRERIEAMRNTRAWRLAMKLRAVRARLSAAKPGQAVVRARGDRASRP